MAVPFGFWLRTNLPEKLHALETIDRPAAHRSRGQQAYTHWRVFLLSVVVLGSGTIASYIFTYIVTYSQATLHLPAEIGFIATTGGYVLGIAAVLYGGWLSDKYGRRPINVWGNLLFLMLIYPTFIWITSPI